jgi:hypothetical protein
MLRVSDVWERALYGPEEESAVTLSLPEHVAEPSAFPVASDPVSH